MARHANVFGDQMFMRFEQLRVMHSVGVPGCFGFKPGIMEPRVSPTASFLLLCADIESIGYKPSDLDRYYLETYNAAHFIASAGKDAAGWVSEVELYYVDREYVQFIGNVEQQSWFHVSGPLALEALSRSSSLTGRTEAESGWLVGARNL